MQKFVVISCLLLFLSVSWAKPTTKTVVTPSAVTTTVSWANKSNLNPENFVKFVFQSFQQEYYLQSMDKVFEEIIQTKENPAKYSKTVTKKVYFFVKPSMPNQPEALVCFKITTVTFDRKKLKGTKIKIMPQASIVLDTPCKLYTDYFDFVMDRFDVQTIGLMIKASSNGMKWTVSANFSFRNLFLIRWLSAAKTSLKLSEEPKVHSILLFFKQRFQNIGEQLYTRLMK